MADVSTWYSSAIYKLSTGTLDLDTYTSFKMHLCKKTYTPSASAHEDVADLTLCDATGYASQSMKAASITVTDAADGSVYFDYTGSIVFASLGGNTDNSVRYAVVYMNESSVAAAQPVVMCLDFGSTTIKSTNGSDFKVTINASGVGKIATA